MRFEYTHEVKEKKLGRYRYLKYYFFKSTKKYPYQQHCPLFSASVITYLPDMAGDELVLSMVTGTL